jgi:hypothetical protein
VANLSQNTDSSIVLCKICEKRSVYFGETEVLRKYCVRYFRCESCGFMQTEAPYWLEEAYSSAIAKQDVGAMERNLYNRDLTSAVLNLLFPKVVRCIDYGAGHGVFVRLMRDRGFAFFWSDLHATNDYARGFEIQDGMTYDFLTGFELLEHLVDPIADLSRMMSLSENVFVSTCLVPQPTPGLSDWWYYVPTTGQHIAFYTKECLAILAARFGRNLLSVGPYHLFTKEPTSAFRYRLAFNSKIARIAIHMSGRASLVERDFKQMTS